MLKWNEKTFCICLICLIAIFYIGCKPIVIGEPLETNDIGSSNATKKSGELSTDEVWSKTILVEGDVVIPKGVALTIDSGTKVKFTKNSRLIVNGTLYAEGKPNQSITLTSNQTKPKPGDWDGVIFSEDSLNSRVEYCVFQFHTQIICRSDSLRLNKSIIAEGSVAGIVFEMNSPTIEDNMITQNATGIVCDKSASPTINHNAITSNLVDGIECSGSSFAIISYNVISNNRKNGIYCHSGASPEINFNSIMYNGGWAVTGGGKMSSNFIKGNREQGMDTIDTRDSLSSSQYQGVENNESPRSTPIVEAGVRKEERW